MSLVDWIWKSKGVKRTLASVFSTVALVAPAIPVLAPHLELFITLAGFFGGAGLVNTVVGPK